jgi:quercetin dioxygenase-like cupin family protein
MTQARIDRPQAMTFMGYNLNAQLERLRADTPLEAHGRDSLSLVRDPDVDMILVVLKAGGRLNEHTAPGPISVLVLEGRIVFSTQGQQLEAGAHDLITLPVLVPHAVEALEPSAILITIAAPKRKAAPS